ncbi:MAG: hypothetical protein ACI8TX_000396 [Hyphomicrobiaceae bacterium]|jgi:uncharacterized protein (DUF2062 family)
MSDLEHSAGPSAKAGRTREAPSVARRALDGLVHLRGSPEDIARGAAVGLFVAFTPTMGAQMVIAAAIATAFGASRPTALVPVWITNPATMLPIYLFTYRVGGWFMVGPAEENVSGRLGESVATIVATDFWRLDLHALALAGVGWQVFAVLAVGGFVVGSVAAAVGYVVVANAVRLGRRRRHHPVE